MLLTGTHELTIDPKNRLSVPSGIRAKLEADGQSGAFYLARGEWRGTLKLYPEEAFEEHAEQEHADLETGEEKAICQAVFFAEAEGVEIDKQGRVVLPQRMLERARIGKRVVLSGMRDHLLLWDRDEFDRFMEENGPRYKDLRERARLQKKVEERSSHSN